MLDRLLLRTEVPVDRMIEWRNKRVLARALAVHGKTALYRATEPVQVQTENGPILLRPGKLINLAVQPNHALIPVNEAAQIIKRAADRVAGSFVIVQGEPIAKTAGERSERVARILVATDDRSAAPGPQAKP